MSSLATVIILLFCSNSANPRSVAPSARASTAALRFGSFWRSDTVSRAVAIPADCNDLKGFPAATDDSWRVSPTSNTRAFSRLALDNRASASSALNNPASSTIHNESLLGGSSRLQSFLATVLASIPSSSLNTFAASALGAKPFTLTPCKSAICLSSASAYVFPAPATPCHAMARSVVVAASLTACRCPALSVVSRR